MNKIKDAVDKYSRIRSNYEAFTSKMHILLEELLSSKEIKYHVIESRTKSIKSFEEKIARPEKTYKNPLKEISDFSGIRIIVYYVDDIEKVEKIIQNEFKMFKDETVKSVDSYSPNEFGYNSTHYVVSIKAPRISLLEWKSFKSYKVEIQVRTVLQHSWAAISHVLQYKRENEVPDKLKRKLFRLAGIFELADEQFLEIRKSHSVIEKNIVSKYKKGDKGVSITDVSLQLFITESNEMKAILDSVANLNYTLSELGEDFIFEIVNECNRLGITSFEQLENMFRDNVELLIEWFSDMSDPDIKWGISSSFILYLSIIILNADRFTVKYLLDKGWSNDVASAVIERDRSFMSE